MKIGIITFHNSSNYGAALQAYSTLEAVKKFGGEVEIIDYTSNARAAKYSPLRRIVTQFKNKNISGVLKEVILSPGVLLRNARFKKFYDGHLKLSKYIGSDKNLLKSHHGKYDVVISGSDQIWNLKNNGHDLSYLLDFVDDSVKASYASSFGVLEIPENYRKRYSERLSEFSFLSTREDAGRKLIDELAGLDAKVVVDPVLLHDKEFWYSKALPQHVNNSDFDLFYVNNPRFLSIEMIYKSESPKVQFVSIGSFRIRDVLDRRFMIRNGADPMGFLWFIKTARTVFTSSYHAVLFCLIFQKPFFAFMSGNEGRDERLRHVLKIYELESRIVELGTTELDIGAPISFEVYNSLSRSHISDGFRFLSEFLGDTRGASGNESELIDEEIG